MDFRKLINRYIYRNNGIQQNINSNNLGKNKIIINKETNEVVTNTNANGNEVVIEKEKATEILDQCDVLVVAVVHQEYHVLLVLLVPEQIPL